MRKPPIPALRMSYAQPHRGRVYGVSTQCMWTRYQARAQSRRHVQSASGPAVVSAADLKFGQPLHETHPHLLKPGELTPGISAFEYARRRLKLSSLLPHGSVAIIPSASLSFRSGPVFYEFHQDPNFFYLTGFLEPQALAIIDKRSATPTFHLFVREKNPEVEQWEGSRSGVQAALDVFNADQAGDIENVTSESGLNLLLEGAKLIYTNSPDSCAPRTKFGRFFSGTTRNPTNGISETLRHLSERHNTSVRPLSGIMDHIRAIKSAAEVTNMRKAGRISGRAITNSMRSSWVGEKALQAYLEFRFHDNGGQGPAYVPVVAGGQNALGIHYVRNDSLIGEEDVLLVDAGAVRRLADSYGNYVADITRTWPNSGKFSPAQKDLYKAVLRVQRTCVSLCRADSGLTLDKIHKVAERGLKDGLLSLGFDVSDKDMMLLFPHHVGHYVGLDVHDTPTYARSQILQAGNCITIEPGLYIPDHLRWPKHFRGMGVRIEDSVCVTEESPLVLTSEAVKEVDDIEALRAQAL